MRITTLADTVAPTTKKTPIDWSPPGWLDGTVVESQRCSYRAHEGILEHAFIYEEALDADFLDSSHVWVISIEGFTVECNLESCRRACRSCDSKHRMVSSLDLLDAYSRCCVRSTVQRKADNSSFEPKANLPGMNCWLLQARTRRCLGLGRILSASSLRWALEPEQLIRFGHGTLMPCPAAPAAFVVWPRAFEAWRCKASSNPEPHLATKGPTLCERLYDSTRANER